MSNDSVRHCCSLVLRPVSQGGDFVAPGVYIDVSQLNQCPCYRSYFELYIEGRQVSQALGDTWIKVWLDPDGPGPAGYVHDDTVRVTVVDLRITAPQEPVFGQLNLTFDPEGDASRLLRQSNQAVSQEALGSLERQRLYQIAGTLAPAGLSPKWELVGDGGADIGSFKDGIDDILSPEHDPPALAPESPPATGTLKLKARYNGQDIGLKDEVPIEVFKDHLARDVANFLQGRACRPAVPGLELADGSRVAGQSLVCGPSASHAALGDDGNLGSITEPPPVGWRLKGEKLPWFHETQPCVEFFPVSRGDVLHLFLRYGGTTGHLHWQTVTNDVAWAGWMAETYAGDYASREFRYESIDAYYRFFWGWVGPGSPYRDGKTDVNQWIRDNVRVDVYEHP